MGKKAFVYSPYWPTLGGGEKYLASAVKVLLASNYQVDILSQEENLASQIKDRFAIDIDKGNILNSSLNSLQFLRNYDLTFWVSDGSIPFLLSKKNLLHFQVPFTHVNGKSIKNRFKLKFIQDVVCNSTFTKTVIDSEYGVRSKVVYPPTDTITPAKKEKIILSVGRFDNLMHPKRQDFLIDTFKKLNKPDWKLILAGGVLESNEFLDNLKQISQGFNIEFVVNPPHHLLENIIAKSSIYWHAAGFGQDTWKNPEKAEHFGISTVESMSAGCVPVTFAAGGQLEIVTDSKDGYLYKNEQELIEKTQALIEDQQIYQTLSQNAIKSATRFDFAHFQKSLIPLL